MIRQKVALTLLLSLLTALLFSVLTGCVPNREDSASPDDLPPEVMNESASASTMVPSTEQIEQRVAAAQERLEANEAGQRIWAAMEAHGGLATWYANGPLHFQFNYQPLDNGTPRNTYEVAHYWTSQTRHQLVEDTTVQYGWDGQRAWATDTASIPYDVLFWSLTPYYFVGIPFVLGDAGINLELIGKDDWEGQSYDLVKVTYDSGVGDAPDDYYVIYVHQENNQVDAIRYIVSYPGYFPEGGHAPEKLMAYDGAQTVNGITLPESYRTFWWKDEQIGEHITDITLSEVVFRPELSPTYLEAPATAVLITDQ